MFTDVLAVNTALEMIATQSQITSLTDGSTEAQMASVIYQPIVEMLLREIDPDFARFTAPLVLTAASPAVVPWAYEYAYPDDCMRLRQVRPPASGTGALADPNDPMPVRSQVAYDVIASVPTKVILTNQASALAVYTSSSPSEAMWDAMFFQAVVMRLANPLAMGLSGRPDFATAILEQAMRASQACEMVDESSVRRM